MSEWHEIVCDAYSDLATKLGYKKHPNPTYGCHGTFGDGSKKTRSIRTQAKLNGWKCHRGGIDICPECARYSKTGVM